VGLEANKALTRATYEQVWSAHRFELIDELFADGLVVHNGGNVFHGRDGFRAAVTKVWVPAFPDLAVDVVLQIAEGDLVCDHVLFSGTHTGASFHGIEPQGKAFTMTQTTISRVEDGRVAEFWEDYDYAGLRRQLGAAEAVT
jgi:predicted ester cyclase